MLSDPIKAMRAVITKTYRWFSAGLLPTYLVTLSFVDAFNFSGRITIAIIISGLMAIDVVARVLLKTTPLPAIGSQFALAAAFLLVALVSLTIRLTGDGLGPHSVSHMVAYAVVFVLLWAAVESFIKMRKDPLSLIFRMTTYGGLLAATFVVIEFCAKNFLNVAFDNLLPRVSTDEYGALYFLGSEGVFRARGFAAESGHMALFLLVVLPFVYYYFAHYSGSRTKAILGTLTISLALAFTTSAAATVDVVVAGSLVSLAYALSIRRRISPKDKRRAGLIAISVFGALGALIVFLQLAKGSMLVLFNGIVNKILLTNQTPGSRYSRWTTAIDMFKSNPLFGEGPGASANSNGTGIVNLYLDILVDTGIIGLLIFLGVLAVVLFRILRISGAVRWVYLFSFLVAVMHYVAISDYWFPWVWLLFALVNYSYSQETHGSRLTNPVAESRVFLTRLRASVSGKIGILRATRLPGGRTHKWADTELGATQMSYQYIGNVRSGHGASGLGVLSQRPSPVRSRATALSYWR